MGEMKRRTTFNPKRKIRTTREGIDLIQLSERIGYGGNPEHKRNPGDFGLYPPSRPRADKTLCDMVDIDKRADALKLLKKGVRKGMVSDRIINGYPQNIWAVDDNGHPLEAQLENQYIGTYHGYPMPETDPFRQEIMNRWDSDR